ncbi:MAG: gspG [Candidatus Saccharibacteria bacterium]|nr:gspG [Candidatus Saccharibacteria bacterium]
MWAKHKQSDKQSGFTIVELLIVIVVIGILAAIVIVAYNGIQGRARDSRRTNDAASIIKALELYRIDYGQYPASNGSSTPGVNVPPGYPGVSSLYSYSYATDSSWLYYLVAAGYLKTAPKDPVNSPTQYYIYRAFNTGIGVECPDPAYALRMTAYDLAADVPTNLTTANLQTTCPSAPGWTTSGVAAVFSSIKN